mmetsp:Transcript_7443/g.23495  ORF Transcript_7443/g.23495 Transcript_7443/m.23495 type:complete len:244 (-) Transcript_7443:6-737(-)
MDPLLLHGRWLGAKEHGRGRALAPRGARALRRAPRPPHRRRGRVCVGPGRVRRAARADLRGDGGAHQPRVDGRVRAAGDAQDRRRAQGAPPRHARDGLLARRNLLQRRAARRRVRRRHARLRDGARAGATRGARARQGATGQLQSGAPPSCRGWLGGGGASGDRAHAARARPGSADREPRLGAGGHGRPDAVRRLRERCAPAERGNARGERMRRAGLRAGSRRWSPLPRRLSVESVSHTDERA